MKDMLLALQKRTTTWLVSILAVAVYSLLSVSVFAQAPPPTDPYVANVLDYGATANDETNDTQAIQNAVNWLAANHPGGTVLVPDGTYWVTEKSTSPFPAIELKSNMTFKMTPGAIIRLKPTNKGTYAILYIKNISNVNITGGKIEGERHEHLAPGDFINGTGGEWGHGIYILNSSSHIYIEGVTITECWGDGICIGGGSASTDITISGVVCDDNRRQGCSITYADGVLVKNSSFNHTAGTAPQSGIDIEPDAGKYVKNVQILNNEFINNKAAGIKMYSSPDPNPEISNITVTGNTVVGSWSCIGISRTRSGINVSNNVLSNPNGHNPGYFSIGSGIAVEGALSINNTYSNNTISANPPFSVGDGDNHSGIRFYNGASNNIGSGNCITGFQYAFRSETGTTNNVSGSACNGTMSVTPASLSFGNVATGSTSPEQTYLLTGSNLTSNVTVSAPEGYEISTTSGSGFGSSKTVTPTGENVSQTIYVRFTPTAVQAYTGNIGIASTGAPTKNVALTGTGTGTTGIGVKIKIEDITVFPNPTDTNFVIRIPTGLQLKKAELKIYDLSGKEIKIVVIDQSETTISRKEMKNGIYFYSIFNNNKRIANGKLIVQ
jgi:hypothetical protein